MSIDYVKRIDESIASIPPLSKWEKEDWYPDEAEYALNLISDFLNERGIRASKVYDSLHPHLPFIDIMTPRYKCCLGIGFDEEMDYLDIENHEKKRPELVFWNGGENNPLLNSGDWDIYNVDDWKTAFKKVLKLDVKALLGALDWK